MKKARHYSGLRTITARLFPDLTSLRQITIIYGKLDHRKDHGKNYG